MARAPGGAHAECCLVPPTPESTVMTVSRSLVVAPLAAIALTLVLATCRDNQGPELPTARAKAPAPSFATSPGSATLVVLRADPVPSPVGSLPLRRPA